jgi:hypothetical protein
MKIINVDEYKNITSSKNGVFVFLNVSGCPLCNDYLEILNQKNLSGWTIVKIKDDEMKWALVKETIIGTPQTRIYYDNMVVWEKGGIFYTKQYKEVIAKLKEFEL